MWPKLFDNCREGILPGANFILFVSSRIYTVVEFESIRVARHRATGPDGKIRRNHSRSKYKRQFLLLPDENRQSFLEVLRQVVQEHARHHGQLHEVLRVGPSHLEFFLPAAFFPAAKQGQTKTLRRVSERSVCVFISSKYYAGFSCVLRSKTSSCLYLFFSFDVGLHRAMCSTLPAV